MIAQRRDKNERGIIAKLETLGYGVMQMDKAAGFDLLAVHGDIVRIIEVKNPARKWQLTENEKKCKKFIEHHGGRYEIIQYAAEITE